MFAFDDCHEANVKQGSDMIDAFCFLQINFNIKISFVKWRKKLIFFTFV